MQKRLQRHFDATDKNASHLEFPTQKHYIGLFACFEASGLFGDARDAAGEARALRIPTHQ